MIQSYQKMISQEDKGVVAIEFAIILPVLLITFIGLFDISNLVYCRNKMSRTAQEIGNVVTRNSTITKPQMDALLQGASLIAYPFDFPTSGKIIVTCVSRQNPNNTPQIMWTNSYGGGAGTSKIGTNSLPAGFTGQTAIFTEVFFRYTSFLPGYILPSAPLNLYSVSVKIPRRGGMTTLPAS